MRNLFIYYWFMVFRLDCDKIRKCEFNVLAIIIIMAVIKDLVNAQEQTGIFSQGNTWIHESEWGSLRLTLTACLNTEAYLFDHPHVIGFQELGNPNWQTFSTIWAHLLVMLAYAPSIWLFCQQLWKMPINLRDRLPWPVLTSFVRSGGFVKRGYPCLNVDHANNSRFHAHHTHRRIHATTAVISNCSHFCIMQ